jgi:hypothetical protein
MNAAEGPKAGDDPSKMTDEQIRSYLAAHPELAARVAGADKDGHVTVPIDAPDATPVDATQEWSAGGAGGAGAGAAAAKGAPGGGGGGFGFGFFGGGKKGAGAGAGKAGSDVYQPPSIPVAQPAEVYVPPASDTAHAPHPASYSPPGPPRAGGVAAPAPAQSNFAITGEEDDNPFAQHDNPFGK